MSVDREHRDLMVEAIDRYLSEETTAFEFDDSLCEIRARSEDKTVTVVADLLWQFYDDCDDHRVVLSRHDWHLFQRLKLLLKSDASLDLSRRRIWSSAQMLAAAALALFVWAAYETGVGRHLMIVAVPFGFVSIALSKWRGRLRRSLCTIDFSIYPFTSTAQLLWVGLGVRDFRRERYPVHLDSRRVRSRTRVLALSLQFYAGWLLFSPVALLAQLFPVSIFVGRVVH